MAIWKWVQKYDPDKLDYYRIDLSKISVNVMSENVDKTANEVYS